MARADQREWNVGRFGTWLFLASETVVFAALFAAYVALRTRADDWPAGSEFLNLRLGLLNTVVLVGSSVTMVRAWAAVHRGDRRGYTRWMALTVTLGLVFMAIKYLEFRLEFQAQHFPYSHTFLGLYFSMTAVHSVHVLAGIGINAWMLGPGKRLWRTDPRRFADHVENAGLFWHLVDLVWLVLFPTLYLL